MLSKYEDVDVVVNNAGVMTRGSFADTPALVSLDHSCIHKGLLHGAQGVDLNLDNAGGMIPAALLDPRVLARCSMS